MSTVTSKEAQHESELLDAEAEPTSALLPDEWDELTDEDRAEYERLENQERLEESSDRYAEAKCQQNKKGVIRAYADYKRRLPGSGDRLWKVVQGFAKTKIRSRAWDYGDNNMARTPDDAAVDVTLSVWKQLEEGKFRGQTGRDFLPWLKRICFCASSKYLGECIKNRKKFDRLYKDGDDGPYENPELSPDLDNNETGYCAPRRGITLPRGATSDDVYVCRLIMAGKTYAEIGEYIGKTEKAVERRVSRLREMSEEQGLIGTRKKFHG